MATELLKNVSTLIYALLCCSGCSYQIYKLSVLYFEYQTITEVFIEMPITFEPPSLSLCIRYTGIIDYPRVQSDKPHLKYDSNLPIWELQSRLTINDIFNYTPSVDFLISYCNIRSPIDNRMSNYTSECNKIFKIEKYYSQEYVCYRFNHKFSDGETYQYSDVGWAITNSNDVYRIVLNSTTMPHIVALKPYLHENYETVNEVHLFGQWDWATRGNDSGSLSFNSYTLTATRVTTTRLEYPFEANCFNYYDTVAMCKQKCVINATLTKYNKIPYSVLVKTPYSVKHISPVDIQNQTFYDDLRTIEQFCNLKCSQPDCYESVYFTQIVSNNWYVTEIYVDIPREPFVWITFRAALKIAEFVLYVLSCLGTWFGISVMSFNPVNIFARRHERNDNRRALRRSCERALNNLLIHMQYDINAISRELFALRRRNGKGFK